MPNSTQRALAFLFSVSYSREAAPPKTISNRRAIALRGGATMRLLIQPGDGIDPLVKAISGAKSSVEIAVFRFDRIEIERALAQAVKRGVLVHALIAYTNRGGEKGLRKLEMRLL